VGVRVVVVGLQNERIPHAAFAPPHPVLDRHIARVVDNDLDDAAFVSAAVVIDRVGGGIPR
jgi:hypothetical protein